MRRRQGASSASINGLYGGFKLAGGYGMLALMAVLFLVITWYFDNVIPSEYGVPLPPWFPFTASKLS